MLAPLTSFPLHNQILNLTVFKLCLPDCIVRKHRQKDKFSFTVNYATQAPTDERDWDGKLSHRQFKNCGCRLQFMFIIMRSITCIASII